MKKFILLIGSIVILSTGTAIAKEKNTDIFKEHGFTKAPLTLSNGRYNEFFSNEEIVQIGTVLLNTKTNKIVAFLDEDTTVTSYQAENSSRWLSPDPLAEKYPSVSPYVYCMNNPVNLIDPDGRDWTDKDGNVINNESLKNVKVYIFHDNDFSNQAIQQYDDAVKQYGQGAVALSNTGTTEGFSTDWGNMQGNVSEVMIMTHGKNQSVRVGEGEQLTATGDGKTNLRGSDATNVQSLPKPKGDISNATLLMYSCHSADDALKAHGSGDHAQGDLKGSMKTIGRVFAERFNFSAVQGTKGAVNYHSLFTDGTLPWVDNSGKPYPEDSRWVIYYRPKK